MFLFVFFQSKHAGLIFVFQTDLKYSSENKEKKQILDTIFMYSRNSLFEDRLNEDLTNSNEIIH